MRIAQKNFKYNIWFYDAIAAFIDSSVSLHTTTSISNSKTLGTIRLQHLQLFFFPRFDAKNNRWRGILKFHWTLKHGGINVVSLRGPISFLGRLDEQNMHRNQPTNYMKLQFPHVLGGFLNPSPQKKLYELTIHIHTDITLKFPKASAILHHPILVSPQGTLGLPFASKAAKHAAAPVELPEVVLFCQASNCSIEMLVAPAQKFQEVTSHLYLVGDTLYG